MNKHQIFRFIGLGLVLCLMLAACSDIQPIEERRSKSNTYVGPSIDYKGRFRKGYVRKKVSTNPNAVKRQNQARYYRKTHAKRK